MKIGIIAPSSVPFRVGGAENFWWGMLNHINQETKHEADLIKVPSREADFWQIINTYQLFSELDVSHFDVVISTKYPAWMVQHPNHICYIQHKLRGLYDTYPDNFSLEYVTESKEIAKLQTFMRANQGTREALGEFFDRINLLQDMVLELPESAFDFPGPLIREIVHFLDGIGLATEAIKKYCAIANNVVKRENYFPANVKVETIYHPPIREDFYCGKSDYIFTASRLEQGSKRTDLLIEAMRYVEADIKFKIAGTGSDLPYLRQLANDDPRIEFVGFVNDTELVKYYADALAVLYIPYDEDYGLITIEAMMSSKPVITTIDSGGPNEFVVYGETGYSVPLEPRAIAERIDYLAVVPEKAKRMGLKAKEKVKEITWKNTVEKLLSRSPILQNVQKSYKRIKKITLVSTFPIYPPTGGGKSRIFNLYKYLAHKFDVELVTFTSESVGLHQEIAPGLWETRIPMSSKHLKAEQKIAESSGIYQISDVVMPDLYTLTPAYIEALQKAVKDADFLVASHPYLFPALQLVNTNNLPIWYEAHNIELKLKKDIFPENDASRQFLRLTGQVESDACEKSQLIMVCSQDEAKALTATYGIDIDKCIEVPNGVDIKTTYYTSWNERKIKQRQAGISGEFTALFMGSWHHPNLEAVRYIFNIAEKLSDIKFLIIGNIAEAFPNYDPPEDDRAFICQNENLDDLKFVEACFWNYLGREIDPSGKEYWLSRINTDLSRQDFINQAIRSSDEFKRKITNNEKPPENVRFMGLIDELPKNMILGLADVALNPMTSGTGTNLKMLDYFAAGIPVISTPFGVRGLGVEDQKHCLLAEIEDFPKTILQLKYERDDLISARVENAREYVQQKFDWAIIADNFIGEIEKRNICD